MRTRTRGRGWNLCFCWKEANHFSWMFYFLNLHTYQPLLPFNVFSPLLYAPSRTWYQACSIPIPIRGILEWRVINDPARVVRRICIRRSPFPAPRPLSLIAFAPSTLGDQTVSINLKQTLVGQQTKPHSSLSYKLWMYNNVRILLSSSHSTPFHPSLRPPRLGAEIFELKQQLAEANATRISTTPMSPPASPAPPSPTYDTDVETPGGTGRLSPVVLSSTQAAGGQGYLYVVDPALQAENERLRANVAERDRLIEDMGKGRQQHQNHRKVRLGRKKSKLFPKTSL